MKMNRLEQKDWVVEDMKVVRPIIITNNCKNLHHLNPKSCKEYVINLKMLIRLDNFFTK